MIFVVLKEGGIVCFFVILLDNVIKDDFYNVILIFICDVNNVVDNFIVELIVNYIFLVFFFIKFDFFLVKVVFYVE